MPDYDLPDLKFYEEAPDVRATRKLAIKAALTGGALNTYQFEASWVPYCDEPVPIFRAARASILSNRPTEILMHVPCRKCAKCKLFRQLKWKERAEREIRRANRTWFVTLTFSPLHLAGCIYESKLATGKNHGKLERAAYGHVQKYFKRLRKQRRLKFRYLAIFERGEKTGRPHYHLLIHEVGERPVSKRTLEDKWRSNVHARLVDRSSPWAASYITKYATKSLDVPPRASAKYGAARTEPNPGP